MNMSTSDIKRVAKEKLNFQWGASLLVLALYTFLVACGNIIPVLGSLLILGPLNFGLQYVYYHQGSKKQPVNYWDLFKGFETNFGETFLATIMVSIFTCLWSMLFVIPGIIKSFSYSMYMYLMVREPQLKAMDAIEKSRMYMKGHKWDLFCLYLSFLGWGILCALTFGLLSIYVAPYQHHAMTEFFNRIYAEKNPGLTEDIPTAEETPSDDKTVSAEFIVTEVE